MLTIWWYPCVESSLVLLEEEVCYDQCILLAKLYYPLPCFIPYSKAKCACYSRCFLTPTFAFYSTKMKRTSFAVLVPKDLVDLHRNIQVQLLQCSWLGHRLGLPWYWMVFLGNEQKSSVAFVIASKYCISDSFVHHDGYSISSKWFLTTIVDIMVIWVKFTHFSPF